MGAARRKKLAGYIPSEKPKKKKISRKKMDMIDMFLPLMIGSSFLSRRR